MRASVLPHGPYGLDVPLRPVTMLLDRQACSAYGLDEQRSMVQQVLRAPMEDRSRRGADCDHQMARSGGVSLGTVVVEKRCAPQTGCWAQAAPGHAYSDHDLEAQKEYL